MIQSSKVQMPGVCPGGGGGGMLKFRVDRRITCLKLSAIFLPDTRNYIFRWISVVYRL